MSNYQGKFEPGTPNETWNKAFDLISPRTKVLDVGCSLGNFGSALIEHKGCIVDGIEPDKDDAAAAKKKLRKLYVGFVENAFENDLKGEKYDYIVFLDVIEHIQDPVSVLTSLKKHLNKGGGIIFSIPNMAHISTRLMLLAGDFEYGKTGLLDNTHLHFYTKKEIARVFAEAGYGVKTWDFTEFSYNDELLSEDLKKIGIDDMPRGMQKLMTQESAYAYQYIGLAVVDNKATVEERKLASPDPRARIADWYQQKFDELKVGYDALVTENKQLKDEMSRTNQLLQDKKEIAKMIRLSEYGKYYVASKTKTVKKKLRRDT